MTLLQKIEQYKEDIEELQSQLNVLNGDSKPLIWSIEFAEIFAEKSGFDIIIGNPPYVRQEDIADPTGYIKEKKCYKNLLTEMVKLDTKELEVPVINISGKSDLYTYFYVRTISLLNTKGIHTFICSNSWLDVEYGVWLQKYLLENCSIELIIDNQAKRSFKSADVNTLISIIHPVKLKNENHLTKFVAFRKPFEEAVYTENMIQIETAERVKSNDTYRMYPITTEELYEEGLERTGNEVNASFRTEYKGDKWGSKYLSSPENLIKLMRSLNFELVRLSSVYESSQRNNLKILDKRDKASSIIKIPYLKSIKKVDKIYTKSCELIDKYETQSNNVKNMIIPDIISNRFISDRLFFLRGGNYAVSDTFFLIRLHPEYDADHVCLLLNSTISLYFIEIVGRKNLGGGLLTFYGYELRMHYFPNPRLVTYTKELIQVYKNISRRAIKSIFEECGIDPESEIPIEDQDPKPLPDRAELDKAVFDVLGLTESERKDVYRGVCRLVWNRSSKARNV